MPISPPRCPGDWFIPRRVPAGCHPAACSPSTPTRGGGGHPHGAYGTPCNGACAAWTLQHPVQRWCLCFLALHSPLSGGKQRGFRAEKGLWHTEGPPHSRALPSPPPPGLQGAELRGGPAPSDRRGRGHGAQAPPRRAEPVERRNAAAAAPW